MKKVSKTQHVSLQDCGFDPCHFISSILLSMWDNISGPKVEQVCDFLLSFLYFYFYFSFVFICLFIQFIIVCLLAIISLFCYLLSCIHLFCCSIASHLYSKLFFVSVLK